MKWIKRYGFGACLGITLSIIGMPIISWRFWIITLSINAAHEVFSDKTFNYFSHKEIKSGYVEPRELGTWR